MTAMIEARGLTKRFGKTTALDGLDLVADAGTGRRGARPERRRQDDVRAHGGDAAARRHGDAAGRRPRRPQGAGRGPAGDRSRRAVRRDRAGDDRAREPRDGRPPVRAEPPGGEGERGRRARAARAGARTATGSRARTRAACAAGWTSARASSERRVCCCSTSRPPGLTRAAGSSCGRRSARWCRPGPTCC